MEAVTIWDTKAVDGGRILAFDLVDILRLVDKELVDSTWQIDVDECIGGSTEQLIELSRNNQEISGEALLELARCTTQVIDGDFRGSKSGRPWLRIMAIDSTEFAVVTTDKTIIALLKERFSDVRDSPLDAKWYAA